LPTTSEMVSFLRLVCCPQAQKWFPFWGSSVAHSLRNNFLFEARQLPTGSEMISFVRLLCCPQAQKWFPFWGSCVAHSLRNVLLMYVICCLQPNSVILWLFEIFTTLEVSTSNLNSESGWAFPWVSSVTPVKP
jgi:hypothetical protein